MLSKQNIDKNNLFARIVETGIVLLFPCHKCALSGKSCIKLEISKRCSECVRSGCGRCVEMASSDLVWKKLLAAQKKIKEDEEATLAKLLYLKKQRKLLQKRAGQFIQTDIKDIEELERLEKKKKKKKKK